MEHPMKATNRTLPLAVGFATVAIVLAGCGGSSSAGLSKIDLAVKANAACTTYNTTVQAIPQPSDFGDNPVSTGAYLDKLKPAGAAFDKTMASLKPNSSAKRLWNQFVAAGKHVGDLQKDANAKAHANDRAGLAQDVQAVGDYLQSTLMPLANQLGATACAD